MRGIGTRKFATTTTTAKNCGEIMGSDDHAQPCIGCIGMHRELVGAAGFKISGQDFLNFLVGGFSWHQVVCVVAA